MALPFDGHRENAQSEIPSSAIIRSGIRSKATTNASATEKKSKRLFYVVVCYIYIYIQALA